MLLLDVRHPDIFQFVTAKEDRTKVTGANISVMLTDKFMTAVVENDDFICSFPIDSETPENIEIEYNKIVSYNDSLIMKIKAKELYGLIVQMAWKNAEPGQAFIDQINNYSPDGVYYYINKSNPCGKIVCLK